MRKLETGHAIAISSIIVTPFAALFVLGVAMGGPSKGGANYLPAAIVWGVVAATWVVAALLLWSSRSASVADVVDMPDLILVSCLGILPRHRREWGDAMRSELSLVEGWAARWRFAVGCSRAALLARTDTTPVRVTGSVCAVVVAAIWFISGNLTPSMQVFVVALAASIGAMITLGAARGQASSDRQLIHPISVLGVGAVVACVWLTGAFLVQFPESEEQFTTGGAIVLATGLASILWLTLAGPKGLMGNRRVMTIGMWAGIILGAGYWVMARTVEAGTIGWPLLAPWLIMFVTGAAASRSDGVRAGVSATVWAAAIGTALMFAVALPEAVLRYRLGGGLLLDGEWAPIGTNLNDAIWVLIAVPILGLPFGVFGATLASRANRRPGPGVGFAQIRTE